MPKRKAGRDDVYGTVAELDRSVFPRRRDRASWAERGRAAGFGVAAATGLIRRFRADLASELELLRMKPTKGKP